jgi:lysophospholipase L1-like esterase
MAPRFLLLLAALLSGCSVNTQQAALPGSAGVTGRVHGGSQPVSSSTIQIYAAGTTGIGSAATPLLSSPVTTDASGGFTVTGLYTCPSATTPVYITATGGNPGMTGTVNNTAISLMAALGACGNLSASTFINIDEVTTVGAVWGLQQFMNSSSQVGSTAGSIDLQNGFVNSSLLVNTANGSAQPAAVIGDSTVQTINTIADSLAACVNTNGSTAGSMGCGQLFSAMTPPGGSAPSTTSAAALDLALNPSMNGGPIYNLAPASAPFQPVAASAPTDWSLGFTYPSPTTFPSGLNSATVFIGASTIQYWPMPINNKGIAGQHADQVAARISTDVLGQGYTHMVLLVGANDVLYPDANSPNAISTIKGIADVVRANGIEVILCLLPPIYLSGGVNNPQVDAFNASLTTMAAMEGVLLVDFNTPLQGHPEDFRDGLHPNSAGYAVMEAALSSVVRR